MKVYKFYSSVRKSTIHTVLIHVYTEINTLYNNTDVFQSRMGDDFNL